MANLTEAAEPSSQKAQAYPLPAATVLRFTASSRSANRMGVNKLSEQCQVENYIFVLPYGSKNIECYYKQIDREHLADRYMGRSPKDAKSTFEEIKAFKPTPLPENLQTVCSCSGKPCDPNSSFCHREFVATRFLKDRPGKCSPNKGCQYIKPIEQKPTSQSEET
jgi:hypothetical protein